MCEGFSEVMHLVEQIFAYEEGNVASFLAVHIRKVCDHLGIETAFLISSEIKNDTDGLFLLTGNDSQQPKGKRSRSIAKV